MILQINTYRRYIYTQLLYIWSKIKVYMDKYISKVTDYMSTGEGLSMWLLTYTASLLAGYKCCIGLIFVSVILDAAWGVASVKKRKAFVLSTLMRKTTKKLGGYFSVLLVFICVEKAVGIPAGLCVSVVASVMAMTELWSVCGHILIVNPNSTFFRLLRPALRGEIARKLNITEDEVESVLGGEKTKEIENGK